MRRLALITGASSGIGLALARIYASNGWDVVLTARRQERLEKLSEEIRLRFGVEAHTVVADLADPASVDKILAFVAGLGRTVDGLVNNAGYGLHDGFVGNAYETHQAFMQVLMLAPTQLAHRVLPDMIGQKFGRILNVSSLASYLPASPSTTLYAPAKAYLTTFSQSLHLEARDHGVHVTALCPGFTYSEFHDVNGSRTKISANVPDWMWMGADEVASEGYQACEANRAISVPGAPNKASAALLKVLPDDWSLEIISRQVNRIMR